MKSFPEYYFGLEIERISIDEAAPISEGLYKTLKRARQDWLT